jgi:alkylation response protein AidB-like acyl-CoA dehydrogenase
MDFGIDERTRWLRAQAREFLAEHLTPRVRARVAATGEYHDAEFHAAMAGRGWIGAFWPAADGGLGWDREDFDVLYEEMASAGAPMEAVAVTHIIAETIRRIGTPEQKERIVRPVARGEVLLALGYTEPEAGSDLAAARTQAVRDGEGWLINGQKIFTTLGHLADYVFLLARTSTEERRHRGLTMFLVPTTAAGFACTPVHTLSGERTNVTYYHDLRVGDEALIGQPGQGWEIVNLALAFERGGEFAAQLRRLARAATEWGSVSGADRDPAFLSRLGRAAAASEVSRLLGAQASQRRTSPTGGAVEGAIAKVYATEALLRHSGALLDATGLAGLLPAGATGAAADGELQHLYREAQIATIYGGTSEVLRGVVAERRLGLPRSRGK